MAKIYLGNTELTLSNLGLISLTKLYLGSTEIDLGGGGQATTWTIVDMQNGVPIDSHSVSAGSTHTRNKHDIYCKVVLPSIGSDPVLVVRYEDVELTTEITRWELNVGDSANFPYNAIIVSRTDEFTVTININ